MPKTTRKATTIDATRGSYRASVLAGDPDHCMTLTRHTDLASAWRRFKSARKAVLETAYLQLRSRGITYREISRL